MQPHDINQRPTTSDIDGRRDAEQSTAQDANRVAFPAFPDVANGTMRVTHADGQPLNRVVNMSAGLFGNGGLAA
jgi:hypothetical protein